MQIGEGFKAEMTCTVHYYRISGLETILPLAKLTHTGRGIAGRGVEVCARVRRAPVARRMNLWPGRWSQRKMLVQAKWQLGQGAAARGRSMSSTNFSPKYDRVGVSCLNRTSRLACVVLAGGVRVLPASELRVHERMHAHSWRTRIRRGRVPRPERYHPWQCHRLHEMRERHACMILICDSLRR